MKSLRTMTNLNQMREMLLLLATLLDPVHVICFHDSVGILEIPKGGLENVLVLLFLTSMGAIFHL